MSRSRCWCFTLNNYSKEELTHLHNVFKNLCDDFAAQEETGETGTPHIQGYLYFKEAKTFNNITKLIPRAHVEKARKAIAAKQYCLKAATRTGDQWQATPKSAKPWPPITREEFIANATAWYDLKHK